MVAMATYEQRSEIGRNLWSDPVYREKMMALRKAQGIARRKNDGLDKYQRYRLKDLDAYRKTKREWARTPDQRAKRVAYNLQWRAKNREHYNDLASANYQLHKHKHLARNRNYHLKYHFGITSAVYENMLEAQNGVCFLCRKPPTTKRLHVDHDHKTGKIRKLLCARCNNGIGFVDCFGVDKLQEYVQLGL